MVPGYAISRFAAKLGRAYLRDIQRLISREIPVIKERLC